MVNYYDELEIEDFAWDPDNKVFHFPCPCGDRFEISKAQLREGEEIATCPSCSLLVRVIYDYLDWEDYATTDEDGAASFASADDTPESPLANTPLVDARVKADSPSSSEAPTSEGGVSSLGQDRQVQKAYDRSRPPDGTLHVSMGQLHFGDDVETLGRQTDERLDNTSE